jgi:hypothetical protein
MGLNVRKVPADWQHPKESARPVSPGGPRERMAYDPGAGYHWQPLHDESWRRARWRWTWEWLKHHALKPLAYAAAMFALIDPTKYKGLARYFRTSSFEEWWGGSPEPRDYRPWWRKRGRTHLQLYETVTEGTPLSPPMPCEESLARWLSEADGRIWCGANDMSFEDWMRFLGRGGSAMSMVISGGKTYTGIEWETRPDAVEPHA